jgi:hypothetical protein
MDEIVEDESSIQILGPSSILPTARIFHTKAMECCGIPFTPCCGLRMESQTIVNAAGSFKLNC